MLFLTKISYRTLLGRLE